MTIMYDPPSGWRYGFPRPYKPLDGEALEQTLLRDGYPQREIDNGGAKYCRFIGEREELEARCPMLNTEDTAARLAVEGVRYDVYMAAWRETQGGERYCHAKKLARGKADNDNRIGDWMQLYSGKQFWPMDPRADEIEIEDIAHSLSMQCRYAGHCIRFYSVAEHSVLLARYFLDRGEPETAMWALLHDASEAYLVDVPRPVKPFLPGYKEAEARVMVAVRDRFELAYKMPTEVHDADSAIIGDERANMKPCVAEWAGYDKPLGVELFYWPPERAEAAFLTAYREIQRVRQQQRRVA